MPIRPDLVAKAKKADVELAAVQADDLPEIAALYLKETHYAWDTYDEMLQHLRNLFDGGYLVRDRENNALIGFVLFDTENDYGNIVQNINNLIVSSAHRNKKLGSLLLDTALADFSQFRLQMTSRIEDTKTRFQPQFKSKLIDESDSRLEIEERFDLRANPQSATYLYKSRGFKGDYYLERKEAESKPPGLKRRHSI